MNIIKNFILILLSSGTCLAQIDGVIYSTLVDSTDTTYNFPQVFTSTHGITPYGSQTDFNITDARIVDVSYDNETMLLYNYVIDSSIIVNISGDLRTVDTLNLNGSGHRFANDADIIIYSNYPELYKISLTDNEETLIANTYANLHGRNIHFTLSSTKEELIFLKQTAWTDSLDMVKADIESMETEVITRISYNINFGMQWAQDGFIYFNMKDSNDISQLHKIHHLSENGNPSQLTFFENNCNLIGVAETNFDKIIFETSNNLSQTELWIYDITLSENSFLQILPENYDTFEFESSPNYQTSSPDGSKIVIGSTITYWWFFISGSLDVFDIETGNLYNISDNYSGGPIFWIDDNTYSSTFNSQTPNFYELHDANPNPFNPITTLSYKLAEDTFVNITIYDMMGRFINNLVSSKQSSGFKSIQWNGTDNFGQPVSSGVYLYQIEAGNFSNTKKMLFLK